MKAVLGGLLKLACSVFIIVALLVIVVAVVALKAGAFSYAKIDMCHHRSQAGQLYQRELFTECTAPVFAVAIGYSEGHDERTARQGL